MRTLFSQEIHVHYGQLYVESDPEGADTDMDESFGGQSAGLCGGAVPGLLFLQTGLHTGDVPFTVELHQREPDLGGLWDSWEEIVEVSFRPVSEETQLVQWAGEAAFTLDLEPIDYRVRYCARGMDSGHREDTRLGDEEPLDEYLLQFWPSAPSTDRVVKQTSAAAAYWHRYASEQPPPPTPEEKRARERERRRKLEQEALEAARSRRRDPAAWGGRVPSERLSQVTGNVSGLVELDAELVHAVDAAGEARQRSIARWAARRACVRAGLDGLEWIAEALERLDRGEPLPALFQDAERAWEALYSDRRAPVSEVESILGGPARMHQQSMAFPSIWAAGRPDPLQAALDALFDAAAAFGDSHPVLFAEVRREFPWLAEPLG